jgi:hypothetical protein
LQPVGLHVVDGAFRRAGEPALQAAGEAALDDTGLNLAVVGSKRPQGVRTLRIRPKLQCDAEAGELALPRLGQLRVGPCRASRGHHDLARRAGPEEDHREPGGEDDANDAAANDRHQFPHALSPDIC